MLLCRVHNTVTDQRYEFRAADQAEIDARLERKAAVYGRPAWTETIPAWTQTGVWSTDEPPVFDPQAIIEHPEQVIEHPAERAVEVVDTSADEAAESAEKRARQDARTYFRDLDWSKIPEPETRRALRNLWRLFKHNDMGEA